MRLALRPRFKTKIVQVLILQLARLQSQGCKFDFLRNSKKKEIYFWVRIVRVSHVKPYHNKIHIKMLT